tara:strand:- start:22 stop:501 length:480 start_codon:yes stop_codon:yes gene_type:complete
MNDSWRQELKRWVEETSISRDAANWAIKEAYEVAKEESVLGNSDSQRENLIRNLRDQNIKRQQEKEKELDDISLSTPSSYKLQVSIPITINLLLKAWAAAEGRDLASVALQCLEIGLRELKAKGNIPLAAIEHYEKSCEKRIAIAEINNKFERFTKRFQ